MDLGDSLLVLAIERLEEISLDELATKINTAFPDKIGKPQALHLLMGWLHEQIKRDRIIDQGSLLPNFVSLLTCGTLHMGSFRKEEVDQAFEEWQRKDAEENPANRRRYLMAQAKIQHLFEQTKIDGFVTLETTSRPQESPRQHVRKSRAALLQKSPVQSPLGNITNKEPESEIGWGERQTGSNVIPLGQRSAPSAGSKREIIEIEDDEEEQLPSSPIPSRGNPSAHRSGATDPLLDSDADELCPTNLDPRWDKPPAPDYRCEICREVGKHFATLCPLNKKKVSLTKQRERAGIRARSPVRGETHRYRRRRSPSFPYERSRSRTPTRPPRRKGSDAYRPGNSAQVRMRMGHYAREDAPISEGAGECNIRGRKAVPSRNLDNRSSAKAEHRNEPRPKRNEGRLSYDDDVFIDSQRALQTPKANTATKQQASGRTKSKDEVVKDTESEAVIAPEDTKKAEEEAEKFLQVMKLEIGTVDMTVKDAKPGIASDQANARVPAHDGADDELGINGEACQGDGGDASAAEDDPTLFQSPDGIQYRLVRESRFRLEVVALFKGRANPIVHSMANRRSARQVWEEADRKNAA
ncbi:hypothetical protein DL764_002542 [Monosporascus ibericus]|uniref:Zinc knuckle CX2CX3GHX4C domain-containing protein n=1 Tax=Monosporascus ibericus TaxID=155417 RepID=A0A4Q4TNE7_9PEZI|nr:hypothetical protein DL764_002542 [Monosporascus ibericus]